MVVDLEDLEKMDASDIHAKRLNAKEVITLQNDEKIIFLVADGNSMCTKEESCFEETLSRVTLEHKQYSLNKARLRHNSQQQKSWMSLHDDQTVTDNQLTPYQHTLKLNWRTLQVCSKFQSQNVQTHGYVSPRQKMAQILQQN